MNTRIKELAKQSGWTADRLGYFDGGHYQIEKFAELIVKECIDVCANGWSGEFTAAGISQCVNDLKKHFGVEE
jgi:hypothetical protein